MNTKRSLWICVSVLMTSGTLLWLAQAATPSAPPPQESQSWIPTSHFSLEFADMPVGDFWYLDGLDTSLDVISMRSGNDKANYSRKVPGELSVCPEGITIRGPFGAENDQLRSWVRSWQTGNERLTKDAVIRVRLADQSDALNIRLRGAWPSGYQSSRLGLGQSPVGIQNPQGILQETFVLQVENVILETP